MSRLSIPALPSPRSSPSPTASAKDESEENLPESEEIKDWQTITLEAKPFAFGGYADVYRGSWLPSGRTERLHVAAKVLRFTGMSRDMVQECQAQLARVDKRLSREMYTWQKLHHPHITPLLGFMRSKNSIILGDSPFLVSPYYANGNILRYLPANPGADRLKLLWEVADGLNYLHTFKPVSIAHLDIKGENILINDHKEAALCDFGVARMLDDVVTGFTTSNPAMSLPFASPELLDGEKGKTPTDVYAYAGLCLQVLSGEPPHYKKKKNVAHVTLAIARGELPLRKDHPISLPSPALDRLWELLERCWKKSPSERPLMSEVMEEMQRIRDMVTRA